MGHVTSKARPLDLASAVKTRVSVPRPSSRSFGPGGGVPLASRGARPSFPAAPPTRPPLHQPAAAVASSTLKSSKLCCCLMPRHQPPDSNHGLMAHLGVDPAAAAELRCDGDEVTAELGGEEAPDLLQLRQAPAPFSGAQEPRRRLPQLLGHSVHASTSVARSSTRPQ